MSDVAPTIEIMADAVERLGIVEVALVMTMFILALMVSAGIVGIWKIGAPLVRNMIGQNGEIIRIAGGFSEVVASVKTSMNADTELIKAQTRLLTDMKDDTSTALRKIGALPQMADFDELATRTDVQAFERSTTEAIAAMRSHIASVAGAAADDAAKQVIAELPGALKPLTDAVLKRMEESLTAFIEDARKAQAEIVAIRIAASKNGAHEPHAPLSGLTAALPT